MRMLFLSSVITLFLICPAFSASILDHSDWQNAQRWEEEISVPSDDQEIAYRCSAVLTEDSEFALSGENPEAWLPHEMNRRSIVQVEVTYSIPCKQHGTKSMLHRRVGFMPLLDVLSILGVGLFALAASGVAAFLRRRDAIRVASLKGVSTPRLELHRCHSDYLHELPSSGDPAESEYVLKYLKTKLG